MPMHPPVFGAHDRRRDYAQQRGGSYAQGYTARWDRLARNYRRMNPLCVGCLAIGRTTLAQCVDHVVPHKGDALLMWSTTNLQALCFQCHNITKQKLEQLRVAGLLNDADLHMNSAKAVALTKRLQPV